MNNAAKNFDILATSLSLTKFLDI